MDYRPREELVGDRTSRFVSRYLGADMYKGATVIVAIGHSDSSATVNELLGRATTKTSGDISSVAELQAVFGLDDIEGVLRPDLQAKHPNVSDERIDEAVTIAARALRAIIDSETDDFGASDVEIASTAAKEIREVLTTHDFVYSR